MLLNDYVNISIFAIYCTFCNDTEWIHNTIPSKSFLTTLSFWVVEI